MREMHPVFANTPDVTEGPCMNWNNFAGLTKRMVDVVNQCKYLASKRGMSLKELRRSMREDEARQRQLMRQNELQIQKPMVASMKSQVANYYWVGGVPGGAHCSGGQIPVCYPIWNHDGAICSQFNWDNYGVQFNSSNMENETVISSHPPKISQESLQTESSSSNEDNLVDLLYSANTRGCTKSPATIQVGNSNTGRKIPIPTLSDRKSPPSRIGGASGIVTTNRRRVSSGSHIIQCESTNSIPDSESSSAIIDINSRFSKPVRKMASHDLTTLMPSENKSLGQNGTPKKEDDISYIMVASVEDFSTSEDEEDKTENYNADVDGDFNEDLDDYSLVGERNGMDGQQKNKEGRVVSPLLKKVESAFADLQKNDSLFGDRNDFGSLMKRIL